MEAAKISFTDPGVWRLAHAARSEGPPGRPAAVKRWIHLQHVPTHYDEFVGHLLDKTLDEHQGLTESALAISGIKHLGKSDAVTSVLLNRAMASGKWQHRAASGYKQVPFVFVEATERATAKTIMKATCRFLGLPVSGDSDDLKERLRTSVPHMGVQAIVVDECQNFRRRSPGATTITDGLRGLLHLPVPMVFIGIDLDQSALLRNFNVEGDSVEQIIERTNQLHLLPAAGNRLAQVARAVRRLDERLSLIDGFDAPALRSNDVLHQVLLETDGRVGAVLERIKKAAAASISTDRCLDEVRLLDKATARGRITIAA